MKGKLKKGIVQVFGIKLRYQMLILYLIGGVLPMMLIGSYLVRGTNQMLVEQAKTTELTELEMVSRQVEEVQNTVNMVSKYFFFDKNLEKIAFETYSSYQEMVTDYRNFTAFVDYGQHYNDIISRFSVYLDNETIRGNSQIVRVDDEIRQQDWYQKLLGASGGPFWQYLPQGSGNLKSLALTRMLKTSRGRNVGALVLHIRPTRLLEILNTRGYDTMLVLNGETVVSEKDGNQVSFDQISDCIPEESDGEWQDMVTVEEKTYVMTCVPIQIPESEDYLQVISLRSRDEILQEASRRNQKSVWWLAASVVLAIVLLSFFSWSFSKRVERFHAQMQKAASGDFQLEQKLGGSDEISELYDYLGTMIFKSQKLLAEIYQERLHAEQLLRAQKEAEFEMLASQINPHFLYNTLEVIRMKARMQQQYEIEELVKMLAKLLRRTIRAGGQDVPLHTEIDLVICYLKIQQCRFGDRIQYQVEIEPGLEDYRILPLVLQPIVENSIIHGLEIKEGIGHIFISAAVDQDEVRIVVADDGEGMTEEKLTQVQEGMESRSHDGSHIGIGNVHQRIRLKYGKEYGLTLQSRQGEGTQVTIRLPHDEKEKKGESTDVEGNGH